MRGGHSGTGSKNPTHSCPGDRWKWSAFYAIAEFLEFPHHACGARAFGLGTHRWPPFLVADPLMEDHPQHSAGAKNHRGEWAPNPGTDRTGSEFPAKCAGNPC